MTDHPFMKAMGEIVLADYGRDTGVSPEGLDHEAVELTGHNTETWLVIAMTVAKAILDEPYDDEDLVNFATPWVLGLLAGATAMRAATGGGPGAGSAVAP